jgi:hypothetical protein
VSASIFGELNDFFNSTTWSVLRTFIVLFLLVFWAATVFWVRKDARLRIADSNLVWVATALGAVFPLVGPLIYMLFRPPEYLEDVKERELEIEAIQRRLGAGQQKCTVCNSEVEAEFLVCPVCTTKLRQACAKCAKPLQPAWQVCPYCETPVGDEKPVPLRSPATRRPRQTRRTTS